MSDTPNRVFTIEDDECPIPVLSSFTMDEAVVFYDNNGYPVEELWLMPQDEAASDERLDRLGNPNVVKTLLHVAYLRKHPGTPPAEVQAVVGKVPLFEALAAFIPDRQAVAVPLARTSGRNGSSKRKTPATRTSSGSGSKASTDAPATRRAPTGTTR